MANSVLVDSCIWISFFFENDTNHAKAVKLFEYLAKQEYHLVVTRTILLEVFTVLKRKKLSTFNQIVKDFLNNRLAYIDLTPIEFRAGCLDIFKQNRHLSIVDSFLVFLAKNKKYKILSFDKHLLRACKKQGVEVLEVLLG